MHTTLFSKYGLVDIRLSCSDVTLTLTPSTSVHFAVDRFLPLDAILLPVPSMVPETNRSDFPSHHLKGIELAISTLQQLSSTLQEEWTAVLPTLDLPTTAAADCGLILLIDLVLSKLPATAKDAAASM